MPDDVRDQLLLLLELQAIDARVYELRATIESLPQKLAAARKDMATLEGILQAGSDRLSETEAWRKEQESLIQLEDEAIKKAKLKLQSSKSSKDYMAASRELENKRKSRSEREEEVLKVLEAMDRSRATLKAHQEDIEALRARIGEEEEKVATQVAELEAEAQERAAGRDDLVGRIDPSLMRRYEVIIKKRGIAVAPVIDGICQGCHMAVPPQLNNQLARLESIESCPRCTRLLYRSELLEPSQPDDAGSQDEGS